MSRLRHLALTADLPYFACKYGYSDVEGYMQCDTCHRNSFCDLVQLSTPLNIQANNPADAWTERNQKLDCLNGNAINPNFFKCKTCPYTRSCEIFNSTAFEDQQEIYYQNLRSESLEACATYYRAEYGHWRDSDFDAPFQNFKSVDKDKSAPDLLLYNACRLGDATHPKFWRCEKCNINCEIGEVRRRKIAQKKIADAEKVKNFFKPVKTFFEKVADFFN